MSFSNLKATKHLKKLAESPFNLKELSPERIAKFSAHNCGYKLLYAAERITEEVEIALFELANESRAHEKMLQMQQGAIINKIEGYPSENREVLHTATRDFFENPIKNSNSIKAASLAHAEVEKLKSFMKEIDQENRFKCLIQIGIGGSYLGPQAHYEALQLFGRKDRNVFFLANIDPDEVVSVLQQVDLSETLVLVVSKTGTTLETSTNEALIRDHLQRSGLNPQEHMVSISMPGSPLDNPKQFRACFHIWDWIGGRYSTTSMVGAVVIAWACGFDIFWEFLKGANAMDKVALQGSSKENLPLLAALLGIWNRNFLGHASLAIIPYSQALRRFPAHIQQLDMESNGKHVDQRGNLVDFETGPIIWGEPGTSAQHSFFQLLHQGSTIVPIEFIGFANSQVQQDFVFKNSSSQQKLLANLFAQMIALATGQSSDNPNQQFSGNRPSHLILGEKLSPFALGALLAFYEHKIAFQGFIWGINSFDQEGVQLGKKIADKIIQLFQKQGHYPLAEAYLKEL